MTQPEPVREIANAEIEALYPYLTHREGFVSCPAADLIGAKCQCGLDGRLDALRSRIRELQDEARKEGFGRGFDAGQESMA